MGFFENSLTHLDLPVSLIAKELYAMPSKAQAQVVNATSVMFFFSAAQAPSEVLFGASPASIWSSNVANPKSRIWAEGGS